MGRPAESVCACGRRFSEAFRAERRGVASLLRRLGVRAGDVDDVTQELFLAAHQRWDRYDPERPMRPWLRGFAVRLASDYRRRAHVRWERPSDVTEPADDLPAVDALLVAQQRRDLARSALASLDDDRRAVLTQVDLEDHTVPEASRALGIPLNTAYSRLREARRDFAAAFRRASLRCGA